MKSKITAVLISLFLSILFVSCSYIKESVPEDTQSNKNIILRNDNTNEERNRLLTEDISFFVKEFPKKHKNPFSKITEQDFHTKTEELISKVGQLKNEQVFTELNKIIASVGDAHTGINYWNGYRYPLKFRVFGDGIYIINADKSLEDLINSRILKIGGVPVEEVVSQLTSLISHENESWVLHMLPKYLEAPVYMYGLGIIENVRDTVFTVSKDGSEKDVSVPSLEFGKEPDFCIDNNSNVLLGGFEKNYDYSYLPENRTLYFQYNSCADMAGNSFKDFNASMFNDIGEKDVKKIVVDLRNNTGGNSEILNPFTQKLKQYISKNTEVKVYILVGRKTFSSGMFAIYRIKEAVPAAISVGEPTGGALDCYGEVRSFNLPNSQLPVSYSTKYFQFSKNFSYKNKGTDTFIPDVPIEATIKDYMENKDPVLDFALQD